MDPTVQHILKIIKKYPENELYVYLFFNSISYEWQSLNSQEIRRTGKSIAITWNWTSESDAIKKFSMCDICLI